MTPPASQARWKAAPEFRMNDVGGLPVSSLITTERIHYLTNGTFRDRPNDIWIATYAKAGTIYTVYSCNMLIGNGVGTPLMGWSPFPELDVGPLAKSPAELDSHPESPRGMRCFYTHWQNRDHMQGINGKIIVMTRNVFDTCVSFYKHKVDKLVLYDFADGTFDQFFEHFIAGDVDFGSYFEHLASWWPRRNDPQVLFVQYEEAIRDPAAHLQKMAAFLGLKLTDEELTHVVESTSFAAMKKKETQDLLPWILTKLGCLKGSHISKGGVHCGKGHLSDSQRQRLIAKYDRILKPLGVPSAWVLC